VLRSTNNHMRYERRRKCSISHSTLIKGTRPKLKGPLRPLRRDEDAAATPNAREGDGPVGRVAIERDAHPPRRARSRRCPQKPSHEHGNVSGIPSQRSNKCFAPPPTQPEGPRGDDATTGRAQLAHDRSARRRNWQATPSGTPAGGCPNKLLAGAEPRKARPFGHFPAMVGQGADRNKIGMNGIFPWDQHGALDVYP